MPLFITALGFIKKQQQHMRHSGCFHWEERINDTSVSLPLPLWCHQAETARTILSPNHKHHPVCALSHTLSIFSTDMLILFNLNEGLTSPRCTHVHGDSSGGSWKKYPPALYGGHSLSPPVMERLNKWCPLVSVHRESSPVEVKVILQEKLVENIAIILKSLESIMLIKAAFILSKIGRFW